MPDGLRFLGALAIDIRFAAFDAKNKTVKGVGGPSPVTWPLFAIGVHTRQLVEQSCTANTPRVVVDLPPQITSRMPALQQVAHRLEAPDDVSKVGYGP